MASFLLVYGTSEGQTEAVATHIARVLDDRGHSVTTENVTAGQVSSDIAAFDAILVGASIHMGKPQAAITSFVSEHVAELATKPTAYFQISLSSADPTGREQAATYVDQFSETTGWNPDRIGLFGGALRFSKYGFLKRLMMKQIAKRSLPDVDVSTDIEFTDWDEVSAYASEVAAFVENRLCIQQEIDQRES